jgi:hypothetical protein
VFLNRVLRRIFEVNWYEIIRQWRGLCTEELNGL